MENFDKLCRSIDWDKMAKGQIDPPLPLTQYKIVGVHHSLMHILKNDRLYDVGTTSASIEIYLRKVD